MMTRNKSAWFRYGVGVLILTAGLLAVALVLTRQARAEPAYLVRVTPTEFFSGELKRLKPHLDFLSAVCFKIGVQGPVTCKPDVELWCDGERIDRPKYGILTDDLSDEVTFTVRRVEGTKKGRVLYQARVGGQGMFERLLEEPTPREEYNVAFGPTSLQKPVELRPGADSVIVWAMGGGSGPDLAKQAETEERLKKLPWAMVLRLRVEKRPDQ